MVSDDIFLKLSNFLGQWKGEEKLSIQQPLPDLKDVEFIFVGINCLQYFQQSPFFFSYPKKEGVESYYGGFLFHEDSSFVRDCGRKIPIFVSEKPDLIEPNTLYFKLY